MKRKILSIGLSIVMVIGSLGLQGCGASDLSKLHDSLNKVARSLNAAARTNRNFYENGIYGVTGTPVAIEWRQKGATAIGTANDKLIIALNLAKQLTPETFEQGKLAVLQQLAQASAGLTTGNTNLDLVLVSIAALITQAVILIEGFRSQDLKYVLPRIQGWTLEQVSV